MAVDSFMLFKQYNAGFVPSESQVTFQASPKDNSEMIKDFQGPSGKTPGNVFEVESFNFDIEQVLNIGSQSSGAGAGKVQFNAFNITRKIDIASPILFKMACSGTAFERVTLGFRKSAGGDVSGVFFLRFDFKLVAVKTISWEHDEESPKETVAFEYGALWMRYCQQNADGSLQGPISGGWNRVRNVKNEDNTAI